MRVVVVSRGVPGPSGPLRGIFELDQARALREAGVEVALAALDLRSVRSRRPWGVHETTVDGIDVISLDIPVGRVPEAWDHRAHAWAARRLHREVERRWGRPDVVHAHFSRYGAAVVRSGVWPQPLVLTEHDSHLRAEGTDRRREEDVRTALAGADEVIAVSPCLADVLARRHGVRARVIGNVVDVDLFDRPARAHEGTVLVSAGALVERKGMVDLARAVLRARSRHPDLRLVVVGEGPQRAELEALARSGEPGVITLAGQVSREELAEVMARADGFALLSRWETFGVVYAEAMAAGLPVLATPCGGPEGFIGTGGTLSAGWDDGQVDAALAEFLDGLARADREAIRASVREKFSPAAVAGALCEVYQDLLDPARPSSQG